MSVHPNIGDYSNQIDDVFRKSILLFFITFLLVPLFVLIFKVPFWVSIIAPYFIYLIYLQRTDSLIRGLIVSLYFYLPFHFPIIKYPPILIFAAEMIGMIVVLAMISKKGDRKLNLTKIGIITLALFILYVVWTLLSSFFHNGPSQIEALRFSRDQIRYLIIMLITIMVSNRKNTFVVIIPLFISTMGNYLFAIIQIIHGGNISPLAVMGDVPHRTLDSELWIGGISFVNGMHAGGFVGHIRELIVLLVLLSPIFILLFFSIKGISKLWFALLLIGTLFISLIGISSAGIGSLLLVFIISFGYYITSNNYARNTKYLYLLTVWALWFSASIFYTSIGNLKINGEYILLSIFGVFAKLPAIDTSTLGIRLDQLNSVSSIIQQHMIFGIGGRNFHLIFKFDQHVHNFFAGILVSAGIIGFLFMAGSILGVFWISFDRLKRNPLGLRIFEVSIFIGLIGFFTFGLWEPLQNWEIMKIFWVISGLLIGTHSFHKI